MKRRHFVRFLACWLAIIALCKHEISTAQSKALKEFSITKASTRQSTLPPSNSVSHITLQDSILWIGTSKGAARSTTNGRSWESYRDDKAFANDGIFAIAI